LELYLRIRQKRCTRCVEPSRFENLIEFCVLALNRQLTRLHYQHSEIIINTNNDV